MAKVVRLKNNKDVNKNEAATSKGGIDTASPRYFHEIIKKDPLNQKACDRLMILYRKLKEYKKELQVINSSIRSFESFYAANKKKAGKAIQDTSKKLNRILGLTDKKGKASFDREPIARWKKRRETVLKKIK